MQGLDENLSRDQVIFNSKYFQRRRVFRLSNVGAAKRIDKPDRTLIRSASLRDSDLQICRFSQAQRRGFKVSTRPVPSNGIGPDCLRCLEAAESEIGFGPPKFRFYNII